MIFLWRTGKNKCFCGSNSPWQSLASWFSLWHYANVKMTPAMAPKAMLLPAAITKSLSNLPNFELLLGYVPLNPIVWCYVKYYVWLIVVINKVVLLLSKILVTWIFGYYHIVHKMYSMWFMWKVTEDINHKFFVNSEF